MDYKSHIIFGEIILQKCHIDKSYALWATAPDMDLKTGIHRYTYHNFKAILEIISEFKKQYPEAPIENITGIVIAILSHFYLDAFTAPIFCWNTHYASLDIPPSILKEYINFNIYLIPELPDEALHELYTKSTEIYQEDFPEILSVDEFISFVINELAKMCIFGIIYKFGVYRNLEKLIGRKITRIPVQSQMTMNFYNFLNEFFKKW